MEHRLSRRSGYRTLLKAAAVLAGLLAAFLAILAASGCSRFQARGDLAASIDAEALAAPTIIQQVADGQLDANSAVALLERNYAVIESWVAHATTNWFAYVFDRCQILVDRDYKEDLEKASVRFYSAWQRATTRPALAPHYVAREEADKLKFKQAKDGVGPPPK